MVLRKKALPLYWNSRVDRAIEGSKMASIRDLKKQMNSVRAGFLNDCSLLVLAHGEEIAESVDALCQEAFDRWDAVQKRIKAYDKKADSKVRKEHFRDLKEEFKRVTEEQYEKLGELVGKKGE